MSFWLRVFQFVVCNTEHAKQASNGKEKMQYSIRFNTKWLCFLFLFSAFMSMMLGCTMTSEKLVIKDISKSFVEDSIISANKATTVSFEDLLTDLSKARIIYVGERHTNRAHHQIQLRVIRNLFQKNPNISVGMEMFDHSYQHVLDLWSAGKLDQKTFLKKVHWYANWKYDFKLYSDIFTFIKEKQIKLVGINIPFHIPPKISIDGITSLSDDEKKHLPKKINISNTAHRAYIDRVFKQHNVKGRDNFDNFYMAQCVWEDSMAESIALNLKKDMMVVLTGNGHIVHKFGIPDRAFNRTNVPFRTIYPVSAGRSAELSFADYIWVTP